MRGVTQQISLFKQQMDAMGRQVKATTEATEASIQNADRIRLIFVGCSALGFLIAVVLAWRQTRHLSKPLQHAAEQMGLLAKGELDCDVMKQYINRSDEIGILSRSIGVMLQAQREEVKVAGDMASGDFSGSVKLRSNQDQLGIALSKMMRITHDALSQVDRHVEQVTGDANTISDASQSLLVGANNSSSALVEISASANTIREQTHRNAKNVSLANDFAISSRDVAERGYTAMEEMVISTQEIETASAKIAQIVKLIDDIAFQANLLALNAAVEAARAGRHGKGFSVVAEEVRNLASRSAKAARETAVLVEDTLKRVKNGTVIAQRTDKAFKDILDNAQQTTKLYGEIASASQEQSRSIEQIAAGLAQIDKTTQENHRHITHTASLAQELSLQSNVLREMMKRFRLRDSQDSLVSFDSHKIYNALPGGDLP